MDLADIRASRQRLVAGAGDDNDLYRIVVPCRVDSGADIVPHFRRERIACLRTVEREEKDARVDLKENVFKFHQMIPASFISVSFASSQPSTSR